MFEFRRQVSRYLLFFYLLLYSFSLLIIISSPFNHWWSLLLVATSSLSFWVFLRDILLVLPHSLIGIRRDASDWFVLNRQMKWQQVYLVPEGCVVLSWLIIVQFRVEGQRRFFSLCIPLGGLSTPEHRRLRAYLRYGV